MRHVDMRKLPAAAQEERRRQVIGLRQRGMTYQEIADLVGLSSTCTAPGCLDNRLGYAARLKVSSCQAARILAGLRWPFFSTSHSAL
jgi:hypothetical protein